MSGGLRSQCRRLALMGTAIVLSGCSTLYVGSLDKALFPAATPAAERAPGAVTIRLAPSDAEMLATGPNLSDVERTRVQLPIGAIVEAAALAAFETEFAGGVRTERSVPSAAAAAVAAAAPGIMLVSLTAIRFDYRDDFIYFIPLGPLVMSRTDLTVRLSVEVSVLDAHGATLWSRSYDAGRELWRPLHRSKPVVPEWRAVGVQRLAHEQAWRLLRQVARDVRQWSDAERRRERIL